MSITMILVSSLLLPPSEYFRFHVHSGFWLAYKFERLPARGKSRLREETFLHGRLPRGLVFYNWHYFPSCYP